MIAYVLMKYSLKRGLNKIGEKGEMVVTEELSQLHMRDTFRPKLAKHLTKEQKRDTVEYLIFLKVKRYGRVKGWTCADGRKQ